jgi:uncharacterized membrane protein
MQALHRLALADWLALLAFLACWAGYAWFSEHSRWASGGLIRRTQDFRLEWAYQMLAREVRVTDSTLIGNLVTSVTFYANTTIYIIAGLVAALGAADRLLNFTADLAFAGAGNQPPTGRHRLRPARLWHLGILSRCSSASSRTFRRWMC